MCAHQESSRDSSHGKQLGYEGFWATDEQALAEADGRNQALNKVEQRNFGLKSPSYQLVTSKKQRPLQLYVLQQS